jgi:hypothetical protein
VNSLPYLTTIQPHQLAGVSAAAPARAFRAALRDIGNGWDIMRVTALGRLATAGDGRQRP